ncbi:MAG: hypothetical protein QGG53_15320, partial [Planctomycetota bacterium]|nr:hypothetical protein [Planctomycetota bacterium]
MCLGAEPRYLSLGAAAEGEEHEEKLAAERQDHEENLPRSVKTTSSFGGRVSPDYRQGRGHPIQCGTDDATRVTGTL